MLHTVKTVEYLSGYKLKLVFNDRKVKIVDFEDRLKNAKNMFLPLKNINYFKKVKSDGTTLVWPNGLDLCPDVLYEMGLEVKTAAKKTAPKRKKSVHSASEKPQIRISAKSIPSSS